MIKLLLLIISIYKINTFSIEITQYTVDKCGKTCGEYRETSKEFEEICYKGCDYARNMTACTKCNEKYQNKPANIYACLKGCQSYNHSQIITRNDNKDMDVKGQFDPSNIFKNFFKNFFGMVPSSIFPIRNTTISGQTDDFESLPNPLGFHEDDILLLGQGEGETHQQPQQGIFSHILFPNLFNNIMLRTSSVAKKGQGSVPSAQENGDDSETVERPKMRIIIFPRFQVKSENTSPLDTDNANKDPFFKFFDNDNTPKEDSTIGDGGVNIKRANHDHVMEQAPMNQPMLGEDQGEEKDNKDVGGMLMSDYDKTYVHHLGHPYASPSFVTGTQDTLKTFIGCLKNLRFPPWFLLVSGMLLITLVLWLLISFLLYSKKSNKKMQKLYLSDSLDYILPYADEKSMMENKELILEPALPVKMPVEKI